MKVVMVPAGTPLCGVWPLVPPWERQVAGVVSGGPEADSYPLEPDLVAQAEDDEGLEVEVRIYVAQPGCHYLARLGEEYLVFRVEEPC